jgi:cobalamin synthase
MAGAGAKKRLEANTKRVSLLRLIGVSSYAAFLLSVIVKVFILRTLSSGVAIVWLMVSGAASLFAFSRIAAYAAPSYDASGGLIDGGGDLDKKGGTASYFLDLLYITVFAQCGAVISLKFFYIYLLIPAYALYLVTINFVLPWLQRDKNQEEAEMDPLTRKKMERTERRQQKRATKWR